MPYIKINELMQINDKLDEIIKKINNPTLDNSKYNIAKTYMNDPYCNTPLIEKIKNLFR